MPAPAPAHATEEPNSTATASDAAPVTNKSEDAEPKSAYEGTGPASNGPKPVEVTSVPETPINGATPAGGTPRPELKLSEEPQKDAPTPQEAPAILGPRDPTEGPKEDVIPEPVIDENIPNGAAVMATASHNGTSAGEKRKAEAEEKKEEKHSTEANGNGQKKMSGQTEERPEKKPKITDKIVEKVSEVKDKIEDMGTGGKGKPGRPRKNKNAPPPVGRTERKTRSQGPA